MQAIDNQLQSSLRKILVDITLKCNLTIVLSLKMCCWNATSSRRTAIPVSLLVLPLVIQQKLHYQMENGMSSLVLFQVRQTQVKATKIKRVDLNFYHQSLIAQGRILKSTTQNSTASLKMHSQIKIIVFKQNHLNAFYTCSKLYTKKNT